MLGQFGEKKVFRYGNSVAGLRLVLWGLFKKIAIADNFGMLADGLFDPAQQVTGLGTLFGAFCFAFQIYADFSGYSDMAIGLSKMLGFELMQNFRTPYFSASLAEFWRRWHISLSTWFRDYMFIPLGGSRVSQLRTDLNLLITFLLSGLWHGAKATFLIWGGLHGLALIFEKRLHVRIPAWLRVPAVFAATTLLWLPFRASSGAQLLSMTRSLFSTEGWARGSFDALTGNYPPLRLLVLLVMTSGFLWMERQIALSDFNRWIAGKNKAMRFGCYYILVLLILLLGNFNVKPYFIYFQF